VTPLAGVVKPGIKVSPEPLSGQGKRRHDGERAGPNLRRTPRGVDAANRHARRGGVVRAAEAADGDVTITDRSIRRAQVNSHLLRGTDPVPRGSRTRGRAGGETAIDATGKLGAAAHGLASAPHSACCNCAEQIAAAGETSKVYAGELRRPSEEQVAKRTTRLSCDVTAAGPTLREV
jgi:hypothetical protein